MGAAVGAHINPAVTLGFWQLGKIRTTDAVWYVLAQGLGGLGAGLVLKLVLGQCLRRPQRSLYYHQAGA